MVVKMSVLVFWVVMPCGLVGRYKHFGRKYCLHLLRKADNKNQCNKKH
jgi:hypothetical protein